VSHRLDQVKELITANILFGTLLADAMVRNEVRALVNTGSFWEHMDGTDDYRPVNLYAATKRAFQDILKYYEDADGLHHVTLKLYGVYGPHDSRSKIFSLFRKSMTSAEPLKLSPGRQVIDLVYIDDVVSAYEKAIEYVYKDEAAGSATVSIGSGVGLSLHEIAKVYEDCVGHPLNIKWGGRSYRPREVMRSVADLEPAWRILGWKPSIDLKSGILHMLKEEGVIV
jgi:nucleoside-diphosphate-sugar epimerase